MNFLKKPFRYSNFNSVYWLIGINILFYIAMQFFGDRPAAVLDISSLGIRDQAGRVYTHTQIGLSSMLAMMPLAVIELGAVWSFITYMFMHAGVSHILFNMLGLFIFGPHVERQMGSKEFLVYYLLTGALAGVLSFFMYVLTGSLIVNLVGASGALYAVMIAYAIYFPNSIISIWGIIPLRAPVMVLIYTVLSIFFVVTGGGGNVAHLTHLAGFIFGWFYFMIRFGVNPWRRLTNK
ncbi:MAG: rhomboid family intramembrane serine protease [Treponema sp.]|nr:rhomboid family intramembrane serine protease [Treponema sp.]